VGRNRPHHVRPLRKCLGRQTRSRVGSLSRYNSSGRCQVWTFPYTLSDVFVRLPCLSLALQVVVILLFHFILTLRLDLGFGRRVTWTSDLVIPPGHQMTFKDALHIVAQQVFLKMALPNWAMNLTAHTRRVNLAFSELKVPSPSQISILSARLTPRRTAIYGRNGGRSQRRRDKGRASRYVQ
jgi:hypothetical protein